MEDIQMPDEAGPNNSPDVFSFCSFLNESHKKELGAVDLDWFDKQTAASLHKNRDCSRGSCRLSQSVSSFEESESQNSQDAAASQKYKRSRRSKTQSNLGVNSPNNPATILKLHTHDVDFISSPKVASHAGLPHFTGRREDTTSSPAVGGDAAVTPTTAKLLMMQDSGVSPITSLGQTPSLSNHLFKSPVSTVYKSHHIALSLGANLNDSSISWSSAMETPGLHLNKQDSSNNDKAGETKDNIREVNHIAFGAARMLFSPGLSEQITSPQMPQLNASLNDTIANELETTFSVDVEDMCQEESKKKTLLENAVSEKECKMSGNGESTPTLAKEGKHKNESDSNQENTSEPGDKLECHPGDNLECQKSQAYLISSSPSAERLHVLPDGLRTPSSSNSPQLMTSPDSMSILDVMIGTPRSATSLKKPAPQSKTKKQAAIDWLLNSPPGSAESSQILSHMPDETCSFKSGKLSATVSQASPTVKRKRGRPPKRNTSRRGKKNTEIASQDSKQECEELFSQLSPCSVDALCSAAAESDSTHSAVDSLGSVENEKIIATNQVQTNMAGEQYSKSSVRASSLLERSAVDQSFIMAAASKPEESKAVVKERSLTICDYGKLQNSGDGDSVEPHAEIQFTQFSPTSLKKALELTDSTGLPVDSPPCAVSKATNTNAETAPVASLFCSTPIRWKSSSVVADNSGDVSSVSPSLCLTRKSSVLQGSVSKARTPTQSFGLKQKSNKKFFYPTSDQITEICPKKVFNFGDTASIFTEEPKFEMKNKISLNQLDKIHEADVGEQKKVLEMAALSPTKPLNIGDFNLKKKLEKKTLFKRFSNEFTTLKCLNENEISNAPSKKTFPNVPPRSMELQRQYGHHNMVKTPYYMPVAVQVSIKSDEQEKPNVEDNIEDNCVKGDILDQKFICNKMEQNPDIHAECSAAATSEMGFSTASGLRIDVSEQAKAKAAKVIGDIDHKEVVHSAIGLREDDVETGFTGYYSDAMDQCDVDDDALVDAVTNDEEKNVTEQLLDGVENEFDVSLYEEKSRGLSNKKCEMVPAFDTGFVGFQCASGKLISISEKASIKAKNLLLELENDSKVDSDPTEFASPKNLVIDTVNNAHINTGLENRTVTDEVQNKISQSCVDKVLSESGCKSELQRDVLEDKTSSMRTKGGPLPDKQNPGHSEDITKPMIHPHMELSHAGKVEFETGGDGVIFPQGFPSSIGKSITNADKTVHTGLIKGDLIESSIPGFKSASGKNICVSDNALSKAEKLIEQDNDLNTSVNTLSLGVVELASIDDSLKLQELLQEKTTKPKIMHTKPSESPKDWSKVPKGFRPFKPPKITRKVQQSVSKAENVAEAESCPKRYSNSLLNKMSDVETGSSNVTEDDTIVNSVCVSTRSPSENMTPAFSHTQMAELTEGTAAYLEQDEQWSQVAPITVDAKVTASLSLPSNLMISGGGSVNITCAMKADCQRSIVMDDSGLGSTGILSATSVSECKSLCSKSDVIVPLPPIFPNPALEVTPESSFITHSEIEFDGVCSAKSNTYPRTKDSKVSLPGFCTAGGISISISNAAFLKAKSIVDEVNDCDILHLPRTKGTDVAADHVGKFGNAQPVDMESETTEEHVRDFGKHRTVNSCINSLLSESVTDNMQNTGKNKKESLSPFLGFKTAAGKGVNISEVALEKTRSLFQENVCTTLNEKNDLSHNSISMKTTGSGSNSVSLCDVSEFNNSGFQTLRGSSFKVGSDQNTEHNDTKLVDTGMSHPKPKTVPNTLSKCIQNEEMRSSSNVLVGFQTGRGKPVDISESALEKARAVIDDCNATVRTRALLNADTSNMGTGVGRKVLTSKEETSEAHFGISVSALAQTRALIASDVDPNISSDGQCIRFQTGGKCVRFQTAQGGKVEDSESALAQARDSIANKMSKNNCLQKPCHVVEHSNFAEKFTGFQTAKGGNVDVSKSALAQARLLITSDANSQHINIQTSCDRVEQSVQSAGKFAGFQTAKGGKVDVSESALAQARVLITSDTDNVHSNMHSSDDRLEQSVSSARKFTGFQTAKGGKVDVSESALAQARVLITSDTSSEHSNWQTSCDRVEQSVSSAGKFSGFKTAKGGKVDVSNARVLITSDANSEHINIQSSCDRVEKSVQSAGKFVGFQTAKGGKVDVSESALAQARVLITSDANSEHINIQTSCDRVEQSVQSAGKFAGFQTAKGGKVDVSESALAQARVLITSDANSEHINIQTSCDRVEQSVQSAGKFAGFQTAKGGKVDISKSALAQARLLITSDTVDVHSNMHSSDDRLEQSLSSAGKFTGFQTAKGGKVDVSESALRQAQALLVTGTDVDGKQTAPLDHSTAVVPSVSGCEQTILNATPVKTSDRRSLEDKSMECQRIQAGQPLDEQEMGILKTQADEVLASSHALLQDGEFDEWEGATGVCEPTRPWMQSMRTQPEGVRGDRNGSSILHPCVSTPPAPPAPMAPSTHATSGIRWTGPATFKQYNAAQRTADGKDRAMFRGKRQQSPATETTTAVKMIAMTGAQSSFTTPYKAKPEASNKFITPTKEATKSSFVTPVKQTSTFQNPTKLATDTNPLIICDDKIEHTCQNETSESLVLPAKNEDTGKVKRIKITITSEVRKLRAVARLELAKAIQGKRKQADVHPIAGTLWAMRQSEQHRLSLSESVGHSRPQTYTAQELYSLGVRRCTVEVQASSAEDFRFGMCDFCAEDVWEHGTAVRVGDGALIVMDDHSTVGKEEFCNALLAAPGVAPRLVERDWVYNHYRWVIWKLAALEVSFPHQFGGRCLTPDNVMLQLKYRYDREVDCAQRSALHKIFEHDDTPQKALVLCVSAISHTPTASQIGQVSNSTPKKESTDKTSEPNKTGHAVLELTDGWYSVKAALDAPLSRLLISGKLLVGSKLVLWGAELTGTQDPAPPLQAYSQTMLKICANSTRRARWDSRLGYCRSPQPQPLPLGSLYPDGGTIGCIDVVVTRVYPTQYMERRTDGSTVFLSERAEQRDGRRWEGQRESRMEQLYSEVQQHLEKSRMAVRCGATHRYTPSEVHNLNSGSELLEAYNKAADPAALEGMLSKYQEDALAKARQEAQDDYQGKMQAEVRSRLEKQSGETTRTSVPLLKVRLAGCNKADIDSKASCVLTVWRPVPDLPSILKEGSRLRIYNLTTSAARGQHYGCSVSLTATRGTRYQPVEADDNFVDLVYEPREVSALSEVGPGLQPLYGEVDVVAVVVMVTPVTSFDKASGEEGSVQTVYVADCEEDFLALKFWGGCRLLAMDEVLRPGVALSLCNLQWRGDSRRGVPSVTVTEQTTISLNPKDDYLQHEMDRLRLHIPSPLQFATNIKTKLAEILQEPIQNEPSTLTSKPYRLVHSTSNVYNTTPCRGSPVMMSHGASPALQPQRESPVLRPGSPNPTLRPGGLTPVLHKSYNHRNQALPVETETDPDVCRKQLIQRQKLRHLETYASLPETADLPSPIPSRLRKSFTPVVPHRRQTCKGAPVQPVSTDSGPVIQSQAACDISDSQCVAALSDVTNKKVLSDHTKVEASKEDVMSRIESSVSMGDAPTGTSAARIESQPDSLPSDNISDISDVPVNTRKRKRGKGGSDPQTCIEDGNSPGKKRRSLRLTRQK